MRAWPNLYIPPALPHTNHPVLRLRDSYRNLLVEVDGSRISSYVCGITPYDATHLGHAATYLTFDLIHRFAIASGSSVEFAENITDIDDPLLERAKRDSTDWRELAHDQIDLFISDMTALRVFPPKNYVGVVENIEKIAECVERLISSGYTYSLDGDIYLDLSRVPHALNELPLAFTDAVTIFAERGGDPARPGKRHPLDPLLWRSNRPHEPSWEVTFGSGRPGWHIECTALALEYLTDMGATSITLQGGGSDLFFPHHYMTAMQARALTGKEFARIYVHAGMIALDSEKMSKSRGNLVFVSALLREGYDPMAIRLALINRPYGSDFDWSSDHLKDATSLLARLRSNLAREEVAPTQPVIDSLVVALSENLDVQRAMQSIEKWCHDTESGLTGGVAGELSRALDTYLGVAI